MSAERSPRTAYLAPFCVFLAFLLLAEVTVKIGEGYAHWALAQPRYWVFPVQTLVCAVLLWKMRSGVVLRPVAGFGFAALIGLAAFAIWVSPQAVFRFPPRTDGFRPDFFGTSGWPYWMNLILRLIRMAIVVPFVEELFWRGFLLRRLVHEDFTNVPFGTFTWRSLFLSSFAFCLVHQTADWPAAILTAALFNLVAYRTRSLAACVLTHAITNLALALYILRTGQWGFW